VPNNRASQNSTHISNPLILVFAVVVLVSGAVGQTVVLFDHHSAVSVFLSDIGVFLQC